jgi:hypothetical protein
MEREFPHVCAGYDCNLLLKGHRLPSRSTKRLHRKLHQSIRRQTFQSLHHSRVRFVRQPTRCRLALEIREDGLRGLLFSQNGVVVSSKQTFPERLQPIRGDW